MDDEIKWFTLSFFPGYRTAKAYPGLEAVVGRMRQSSITFFTPWGPPYGRDLSQAAITEGCPEMKTIHRFKEMLDLLQKRMPSRKFRWLVVGADFYGSSINKLPAEVVAHYFDSLQEKITDAVPMASFARWSKLREQTTTYRQDVGKVFEKTIDEKFMVRARASARYFGGEETARAYVEERLIEAQFIEATYAPVKMSCVNPGKDMVVDMDCPVST